MLNLVILYKSSQPEVGAWGCSGGKGDNRRRTLIQFAVSSSRMWQGLSSWTLPRPRRMIQSRVKISYVAPSLFLASDQWIQIRTALDAHLPLRNLHWRSPTRTSIRTIQELDIDLINLEAIRDEGASQIPTSLLDRPFMNLFIFACEVGRLKSTLRNATSQTDHNRPVRIMSNTAAPSRSRSRTG